MAGVSPADLHDSRGGIALLRAWRVLFPFLAHCFAHCAYRGERLGSATAVVVEIIAPEVRIRRRPPYSEVCWRPAFRSSDPASVPASMLEMLG